MFELKGNNFTFTGDVTELASAVSRADEKTIDRFLEGISIPARTYMLGWILTHFYGDDYDDMVNGVLTTVGAPSDVIRKFNTQPKNKCSDEKKEPKKPEKNTAKKSDADEGKYAFLDVINAIIATQETERRKADNAMVDAIIRLLDGNINN